MHPDTGQQAADGGGAPALITNAGQAPLICACEAGPFTRSHALRTTLTRLDFAHHIVDNIVEQEPAGDHPYTPGPSSWASVAGPPSPAWPPAGP